MVVGTSLSHISLLLCNWRTHRLVSLHSDSLILFVIFETFDILILLQNSIFAAPIRTADPSFRTNQRLTPTLCKCVRFIVPYIAPSTCRSLLYSWLFRRLPVCEYRSYVSALLRTYVRRRIGITILLSAYVAILYIVT